MRKLTISALAGVAGAASLAAANRALRADPGSVRSKLDGTERRWNWRGHDVFAIEAGTGPLVLLVHGIYAGSSSYEYRKLFPLLAQRRRVVAIDLLGSGLSERPDIAYCADLFVEQIVAAIERFGPRADALIGSSLGGAFSIRAAARHPDLVRKLVAICPTGLAGTLDEPAGAPGRAITATFRSPLIGEALFNALASKRSLAWFLRHQAYADPASATPEVVDYYWGMTHLPGSRFVPAHFVGGALNCGIAADLPRVEAPLLVAWGERANGPSPIETAGDYVAPARHAELATFARSGLLPHEEEPELLAERVERFLGPVS